LHAIYSVLYALKALYVVISPLIPLFLKINARFHQTEGRSDIYFNINLL